MFASRFAGGTNWDDLNNFEPRIIAKSEWGQGKLWICKLLTLCRACQSNADARRLIQQKAVVLNGEPVNDVNLELPPPEQHYLLKVGKKQFIRIITDDK